MDAVVEEAEARAVVGPVPSPEPENPVSRKRQRCRWIKRSYNERTWRSWLRSRRPILVEKVVRRSLIHTYYTRSIYNRALLSLVNDCTMLDSGATPVLSREGWACQLYAHSLRRKVALERYTVVLSSQGLFSVVSYSRSTGVLAVLLLCMALRDPTS